MAGRDDERAGTSEESTASGLSRRDLLTAGLAVTGAGLATGPAAAQGTGSGLVGIADKGSTAVEFRAHLTQTGPTGEHFLAFGYLTRVVGASDSQLFSGAALDETTALLTAYASGDLSRRVHDGSVHSIDIEGILTIYQRPAPGASWADPESFRAGAPVAAFNVTLLDVLTVYAPGRGLPSLNGDMKQSAAGQLDAGWGPRFGHVGGGARLQATGLGVLVDPATLNAVFEMAGSWITR